MNLSVALKVNFSIAVAYTIVQHSRQLEQNCFKYVDMVGLFEFY